MASLLPKEQCEASKAHKSAGLPDILRSKIPIYKSKEQAEMVLCADSLTVLVVCGEQSSVVGSPKVHIVIN